MSITSLNGALVALPPDPYTSAGMGLQGNFYLGGTNPARFAFIFQAPVDGDIDQVEMYAGAVSGANNIKVSIQDVDGSGLPDGTDDVYKVSAKTAGWNTFVLTDTGSSGGNRKTVVKGTWYACVVKWDSTQSGSFEPHQITTNGNQDVVGGTYCASYNGSSWNKAAAITTFPSFAVKFADGNYYSITNCRPATSVTTNTYNSGSNPDEIGLRFKLPVPARVVGFWMQVNLAANADIVLYNASNSALVTLSLDVDVQADARTRFARFVFPNYVDLDAGVVYRLCLKPTSGTNIQLWYNNVNSAALMAAWPAGVEFYYSYRVDGGSFSDTTTKRPQLGLLIDGFDIGGTVTTYRPQIGGSFGQRGVGVS